MPKYVIIGNSSGGIGAIEAIRAIDREGSLAVISDEPYHTYSRPMISHYLVGDPFEHCLYRPLDFYQRYGVQTHLGRKAVEIDVSGQQVLLEGGEAIPYEQLLIATGGTPIVPPMEGLGLQGVVSFTTLDHAKKLMERLDGARRVVVIGGGLIGSSVTEALHKCGLQVTVVELLERILSTMADETSSRLAEKTLSEAGVEIITGCSATAILARPNDSNSVGGVSLSDGREVPADLVVVAVGVRPRRDVVAGTQIKVNRGIVVDRYSSTNIPNIYACGDAAEPYDPITGANRVTAIWLNAYLGGRIAGRNMAGAETISPWVPALNSIPYFGLNLVSAGLVDAPDDSYEVLRELDVQRGIYKKVILQGEYLVGMTFIRAIAKTGILYGLIKDGVPVGSFKQHLLADNFGFIHMPEPLRKERIIQARLPAKAPAPSLQDLQRSTLELSQR
ncbi:MAG: NAD(P)/FAD-dependent oxidoreductase [Chloroflexi bacterium]|nr:NAD(P)/FAD-dependent oxidoreductase [Chloroflexota bacterium]